MRSIRAPRNRWRRAFDSDMQHRLNAGEESENRSINERALEGGRVAAKAVLFNGFQDVRNSI